MEENIFLWILLYVSHHAVVDDIQEEVFVVIKVIDDCCCCLLDNLNYFGKVWKYRHKIDKYI